MPRRAASRLAVVSIAVLLALVLPFAARSNASSYRGPSHQTTAAVVVFGVRGGNVRPWQVTIQRDGTVAATGIGARDQHLADPKNTLAGLKMLAKSAGFYSMPAQTQCPGTLPDIAARYIQIQTGSRSLRVSVHGGCNAPFSRLWAVLYASADVTY
jgi:hypothetical protein